MSTTAPVLESFSSAPSAIPDGTLDPSEALVTTSRSAPRRLDLEVARIICALGIVWYHSRVRGHEIAYAGLIVFVLMSIYLGTHRRAAGKPAAERARRLLLPWALWATFYSASRLATDKPAISMDNGALAGLLAGPSIHLWYLPFMFMVLVILDLLTSRVSGRILACAGLVMAVATLLLTYAWRGPSLAWGQPWAQYAHVIAAVFAGMFFAGAMAFSGIVRTLMLAALLSSAALAIPHEGVGIPYFMGILIGTMLLLTPLVQWPLRRLGPRTASVLLVASQCTFGIYLLHPFLLMVCFHLPLAQSPALPLTVFATSSLVIWLLRKYSSSFARYAT